MAERNPARIQFGGTLQAAFVPELIRLLNSSCLRTSEDEQAPDPENLHEEFYHAQVKSADLTDLEDFAIRHALCYEQWCKSGSETTTRFMPQSQRIAHVVGSRNNGFYLSEAQLKNGAELLAWMKSPLPVLGIITADGAAIHRSPQAAKLPYFVKITQVLRVQKSVVISVEAQDQADVIDMIDEGSLDIPDNSFDIWDTEHASLESETQELIS